MTGQRAFALTTMVVYALAVAAILLVAGTTDSPGDAVSIAGVFLWMCVPVATYLLVFRDLFPLLAVGAVAAAVSLYVYWSAMFGPETSSTSALVLMFLPIYQAIAVLAAIIGAWIARRLKGR